MKYYEETNTIEYKFNSAYFIEDGWEDTIDNFFGYQLDDEDEDQPKPPYETEEELVAKIKVNDPEAMNWYSDLSDYYSDNGYYSGLSIAKYDSDNIYIEILGPSGYNDGDNASVCVHPNSLKRAMTALGVN